MTSYAGETMMLSIGDGASPTEHFSAIGGLTLSELSLRQDAMVSSVVGGSSWQALQTPAGVRSLRIGAQGRFTDSAAESLLRAAAVDGLTHNNKLTLGNGDMISGSFVVSAYGRKGELGQAEWMSVTLQSAGDIAFSVG